jgi:hypothetical protein
MVFSPCKRACFLPGIWEMRDTYPSHYRHWIKERSWG